MIDLIHQDMKSAGRGGFIVFRGDSGTGKSTFLHTLHLFRQNAASFSIPTSAKIFESLQSLNQSNHHLRVLVLEEREALKDISNEDIERDLHSINGFVRSSRGANTLIVWPCNTDDLQTKILTLARQIGADALLGVNETAFVFKGPDRSQFRKIAENTVATLNQGATLADLGISDDEMEQLIKQSDTVGKLLGLLRGAINRKKGDVSSLLKTDQCKLWIVVAAGNEPDQDVAALTRGRYSAVDIERLMTSTEANIVSDLKAYPDKLGILATVLDAKIFHLPMLAALEMVRTYANDSLRGKMKLAGLTDKVSTVDKISERIEKTDFGRVFQAGPQGTMTRGRPGSNTQEAFKKLVTLAQENDVGLNRAIGDALKALKFIEGYAVEQDFGSGMTRRTDLCCNADGGTIRLEMMWRTKAGRADIANYALTKLYNYGRAIGYLPTR